MSEITLENMEFHAYHGCLEHENTLGNTFLVTLSMQFDTTAAEKTNQLSDTLNYKLVYDVVKAEMEIRSQLIEHVSRRIADAVFTQFPLIQSLKLKLTKMQPPLGAKVQSVSIQLEMKR